MSGPCPPSDEPRAPDSVAVALGLSEPGDPGAFRSRQDQASRLSAILVSPLGLSVCRVFPKSKKPRLLQSLPPASSLSPHL